MLICLCDNWVSFVVLLVVPVILPLPVHLHLRAQNTAWAKVHWENNPKCIHIC